MTRIPRRLRPSIGKSLAQGIAVLLVVFFAILQIPVANTLWREKLSAQGLIQLVHQATTTPTSIVTPTPDATPTPPEGIGLALDVKLDPVQAGEQAEFDFQICVQNNGESATENLIVYDVVEGKAEDGGFEALSGGALDLTGKPFLAAGESYCYDGQASFVPDGRREYRNVARALVSNHAGWLPGSANCPGGEPCLAGPEVVSAIELPATPTPTGTVPPTPTPTITRSPTPVPTQTLTSAPTATPSPTPTATGAQLVEPTAVPTLSPTPGPTGAPTPEPAITETPEQAYPPTLVPTATPTPEPSLTPTPTSSPTPAETETPAPTPTESEAG